MKPSIVIAFLTLALSPLSALSAPDRSYYVTELAPQQKFDVYNDGHNTYLESIPGLVVIGATADGERYIVNGVPQQIRGFLNGKPITVVRGRPPSPVPPPAPSASEVNAKIKQLTEKLESLSSKVQPQQGAVATAAAARPATPTSTSAPSDGATRLPVGARKAATLDDVITYRVTPADANLRLVVESWARMVGWTAVWDVEKDILIGNAGEKTADFKTSVRWLLSSTELGDLVVKPCFYNNAVVRVVRKTVKCNPNE